MVSLNINKRKALVELQRRVLENENGVKSFLEKGGISIDEGKHVEISDLNLLLQINEGAYEDMIRYLYPEIFSDKANADGKKAASDSETVDVNADPQSSTTGATKKGLSSEDKTLVVDYMKHLTTTSGDVLKSMFGKTQKTDNGDKAALSQLKEDMKLILIVVAVAAIMAIGGVLLARRSKK